jgi:hypothetical protein
MDTLRIGTREPILLQAGVGDKLSNLKPGDVVRARVVRVLGGGVLSLRMGGSLIQAKMAVPLPPGATLLFRVLGREGAESGGTVRLQFLQLADSRDPAQPTPPPPSSLIAHPSVDTVRALAQEYAARASLKNRMGEELVTIVHELLKALPEDPASLPRELRLHLMNLLRTSLRETEQSIQNRARILFGDPKTLDLIDQPDSSLLPEPPGPEDVKRTMRTGLPLFAEAENILHVPLQSVLADTGVALEAKLRALAQALLTEGAEETVKDHPTSFQSGESAQAGSLSTDLKARLLQLRERVLEQEPAPADPTSQFSSSPTGDTGEAGGIPGGMLPALDGLLRDIETFQLLSKLTHSFYTFLPFLWKGLREGDIAFKRGCGAGGDPTHYCVMTLDLETLGNVTIVAMKQGGDFFVSFKTDHEGLRSVMDENIDELRGMFRGEGLHLREVSFCDRDDPRLAPFMHMESFESALDLKI